MRSDQESDRERLNIVVTSPLIKEITVSKPYVSQIHARRQINIRALERGYLEAIQIKEGQMVKAGDVLFKVIPTLYEAKYASDVADVAFAKNQYENAKRLGSGTEKVISTQEVLQYAAKLAKAEAQMKFSEAELNFATVKAPFDGIVDRLYEQQGSLVKEGDNLTALSDSSTMWVYFNVPEARYLDLMIELGVNEQQEYQARLQAMMDEFNRRVKIELLLANGRVFSQPGKIGAIEAKFNNETGNIAFRADFPNPTHLLRHGQTGTLHLKRNVSGALLIPLRSTFQILDKRYVYVVGSDNVVHQREVTIDHELDDIFVIKKGLTVNDKIILDGVRQVREGDKLKDFEFRKPEAVLANQKLRAE